MVFASTSRTARNVLEKLVRGPYATSAHRKVDGGDACLRVSVERVGETPLGPVFSVAPPAGLCSSFLVLTATPLQIERLVRFPEIGPRVAPSSIRGLSESRPVERDQLTWNGGVGAPGRRFIGLRHLYDAAETRAGRTPTPPPPQPPPRPPRPWGACALRSVPP